VEGGLFFLPIYPPFILEVKLHCAELRRRRRSAAGEINWDLFWTGNQDTPARRRRRQRWQQERESLLLRENEIKFGDVRGGNPLGEGGEGLHFTSTATFTDGVAASD